MLGLEAMVATSGCTKLQNLKKKIDIIFLCLSSSIIIFKLIKILI